MDINSQVFGHPECFCRHTKLDLGTIIFIICKLRTMFRGIT